MCCMLDYNNVITCSREPIIKLFCLDGTDGASDGAPKAKFEGHEMSVTTVAAQPSRIKIASGSRDCSTRVWDVETQK